MNIMSSPGGAADLSIGHLAERSGLSPATLRMWEQRHGFPVPQRLGSGHRRYTEADLRAVLKVVERRDAGVRLDVAIRSVLSTDRPVEAPTSSVFAELRLRQPHLAPFRLRKSTLVGLSWAIEDEFCARADRAHIFGAFQRQEFWTPSRRRWRELARVARSAWVYADFDSRAAAQRHGDGPVRVALADDSPMRREWAVVCDARELPAALTAWEIPGQDGVPDRDRVFESMWTVEPQAVRDAARVCAAVALEAGAPGADAVLHDLAEDPRPGAGIDLGTVSALFNRVIAYVDEVATRPL